MNTLPWQGVAETCDEKGVVAPRYIPAWVLPQENLNNLMVAGAGAALDIIFYAREVPPDPTPDPDFFERKDCSLILFEIGFCRGLGLQNMRTKKIDKYHPSFLPYDNIGTAWTSLASPSATTAPLYTTRRLASQPLSPRPALPSTSKGKQRGLRHKNKARRPSSTTNKQRRPYSTSLAR